MNSDMVQSEFLSIKFLDDQICKYLFINDKVVYSNLIREYICMPKSV